MARKSKAQRISDTVTTLTLWLESDHSEEKPARFLAQMVDRMERGKYPTAGQRKWLDTLAEEGTSAFPVVHNQSRLDEIDAAINTTAMQSVDVLRDFRNKLKKGWSLSEKQEVFLASLLEQARDLSENGLSELSTDERFLIESLLRHGATIDGNDYYGYQRGKAVFITEVQRFYTEHGTVTSRHILSLQKMFKGVSKALTEKKHPIGSLVPAAGRNGIVMSDVYVNSKGAVVIDIMAAGKLKAVRYNSVGKRLIKKVELSSFWDDK
jgi:hypothetical protein